MKTGILFLNFGGPSTLEDVKPFLYRLFSDPEILSGIPGVFRIPLAFFISQVKGASSVEIYRKIGGGSPQLRWTQAQVAGVSKKLEENSQESFQIEIAMRASEPSIRTALQKLKDSETHNLVLFPLFPQFSKTTTGSCFKEVKRQLQRLNWNPEIREIVSWPDHRNYIALLRKTVDEAILDANKLSSKPVYVLFSAHSLPEKIVNQGDPYPLEVKRTIDAVTRDLKTPWSLAFQSRNGPLPWLKPYTENEIERLAKEGIQNLVMVPISFVSDHIETLYELDLLYADLAKSKGISHFTRSRSFNDDPEFIQTLYTILKENAGIHP